MRNDKIIRGNNRDRSGINGEFLCIKGRYAFDFVDHPERLQSPMIRVGRDVRAGFLGEGARTIAAKDSRRSKRATGSSASSVRTTPPTKRIIFLQKFARQGLGTKNIDHHRTGDLVTLFDALSGKNDALATTADLYTRKAVLVVGADLVAAASVPRLPGARELPPSRRAHLRRHGRTRCAKISRLSASVRVQKGGELAGVESLRDKLKAEPELVIVFGDAIQGDAVRKLVAFGDSLGIPVKYVCLVDYSNSRGAFDMGVSMSRSDGGMSSCSRCWPRQIWTCSGWSARIR